MGTPSLVQMREVWAQDEDNRGDGVLTCVFRAGVKNFDDGGWIAYKGGHDKSKVCGGGTFTSRSWCVVCAGADETGSEADDRRCASACDLQRGRCVAKGAAWRRGREASAQGFG